MGLNFSSATTPELLLKTFDHYCEYRRTPNGVVLAPVQLGKWLVLFCDEINLPDMDKYGTQRVISFLRQVWYIVSHPIMTNISLENVFGSKILAVFRQTYEGLSFVCFFCRWWNMEDSIAPQTRHGSNWRGSSLWEPVILLLTLAENLSLTGTVHRLSN